MKLIWNFFGALVKLKIVNKTFSVIFYQQEGNDTSWKTFELRFLSVNKMTPTKNPTENENIEVSVKITFKRPNPKTIHLFFLNLF